MSTGIGFVSPTRADKAELRVHELAVFAGKTADLAAVKAAHLVPKRVLTVKVIASGTLDKAVTVSGLKVTAGARKIIEAAGGKVLRIVRSCSHNTIQMTHDASQTGAPGLPSAEHGGRDGSTCPFAQPDVCHAPR